MMRLKNMLPAIALGLALATPVVTAAQPATLPSLDFPETGTFCGLFTVCNTSKDTIDTQTPSLALVDAPSVPNGAARDPSTSIQLKQANPKN